MDAIFEALAEHPLDVVRVNVWKMFKLSIEAKLTCNKFDEDYFKDEMANVIKSQKVHKRFDMVKLSAFCSDQRTYQILSEMNDDLVDIVIRSSVPK